MPWPPDPVRDSPATNQSFYFLFFYKPRELYSRENCFTLLGQIQHSRNEFNTFAPKHKIKPMQKSIALMKYTIRYIVLMLFIFDFNVKSITEIITIIL